MMTTFKIPQPEDHPETVNCEAARNPVDEFLGAPATLPPEPIRGAILDAAKGHTLGDRNATHGDPIPAMELFMDLVEPILERRKSLPKAMVGAMIQDAYKRARMLHNPYHQDSYEDGCAYTAIAGEAAHRSRTTP